MRVAWFLQGVDFALFPRFFVNGNIIPNNQNDYKKNFSNLLLSAFK